MSARQLLDQLLQSGQGLARQAQQGGGQGGLGGLGGALGSLAGLAGKGDKPGGGGGLSSLMSGFGGGALSGGALAMLLSNKKARKLGGKAALYGGMAALGVLAYKAYGDWQRKQAGQPAAAGQAQAAAPMALPEPQTIDRLPPAQAEQHSSAILVAMIGAAKADGHVGQEETQAIEAELVRLSGDDADRRWLHDELAKPLDPAGVARAAQTPEMAAEMYLASLLVVDEESFMERAYLDELARQLKLEPGLKAELEAQVKAAVAQ